MLFSDFERCTLPDFAGVYIILDEENNRNVGQSKHVFKEISKKFEKGKTSLVRKQYELGKRFWVEDCICGYSDGRPLHLDQIEAECIELYKVHNNQNGYNRTYGNKKSIMYVGKKCK